MRTCATPVIGNEVTTTVGHFNVFPVKESKVVPDFKQKDWKSIFASIENVAQAKVVILNHILAICTAAFVHLALIHTSRLPARTSKDGR